KSAPPRELAGAIRTVAGGEALLAPEITRAMIQDYVQRPRPGSATPEVLAVLTPRELEVLGLIARGRSNTETAGELFLSERGAAPPGPSARPGPTSFPGRGSGGVTSLAT
ncbi:MAG: response regulator transcription factor, partial [Blastococcus sp.]